MRAILIAGAAMLAMSQASTAQGPTANPTTSENFVALHGPSNLSSEVVGLEVYNENNRAIGQIEDIAMSKDGQTQAYVLSVGGFLGLGEHYVAVEPLAVKIRYSETDQAWHASMNATADQLKAAPKYQYLGRIGGKACINILRWTGGRNKP